MRDSSSDTHQVYVGTILFKIPYAKQRATSSELAPPTEHRGRPSILAVLGALGFQTLVFKPQNILFDTAYRTE